jgi:hypothetical protein
MKVILAAVLIAVVIGVAAAFVLNTTQRPAYEVYSSDASVRVGDPGHNLVGENWSGQPERPRNS